MGARPPSEKLVLGLMLGRIRDDPFNGIQDRMGLDLDRMFDEAGEEKVAFAPRAEDSIWFDRLLLGLMLNRIRDDGGLHQVRPAAPDGPSAERPRRRIDARTPWRARRVSPASRMRGR